MTKTNADPATPTSLALVWRALRDAGMPEADQVALRRRLLSLQIRTAAVERQTLLIVESTTPLRAAGYWMPELAELVGADLVISRKGEAPRCMTMAHITDAAPDLIITACSGASLEENIGFAGSFVDCGVPVYAAKATSCFWLANAHIVETAEILAEILHKDARLHFGHDGRYWRRVSPLNPHYPQT